MNTVATIIGWAVMILGGGALLAYCVWWVGRKMEMRGHRKVAEEARSKSVIPHA